MNRDISALIELIDLSKGPIASFQLGLATIISTEARKILQIPEDGFSVMPLETVRLYDQLLMKKKNFYQKEHTN